MAESASDQYRRLLSERFDEFKQAVDDFMITVAIGDAGQKRAAIQKLSGAAGRYLDVLPQANKPGWIMQMQKLVREGGDGGLQNAALLNKHIAQCVHKMQLVLPDDAKPYDFDHAFVELREQYHIRELFDRLIKELETIISSGEIDSTAVLDSLKNLLGLLRVNREGSFAAIKGTMWWVNYGKNLLLELANDVPFLGAPARAFEKTANETEKELEKVERGLFSQMVQNLQSNEKAIEKVVHKTTIELIGIDPTVAKNAIAHSSNVIDVEPEPPIQAAS